MIRGICCSAFDLLHAGHIAHLRESKENCDWLIVALQTNPKIDRPFKNAPVETIYERYSRLKGCRYVDEIIPYDTEEDLVNLLQVIKPDIRFLGEEYRDKQFSGRELPIQCYFTSREHKFSTTALREKICNQK